MTPLESDTLEINRSVRYLLLFLKSNKMQSKNSSTQSGSWLLLLIALLLLASAQALQQAGAGLLQNVFRLAEGEAGQVGRLMLVGVAVERGRGDAGDPAFDCVGVSQEMAREMEQT